MNMRDIARPPRDLAAAYREGLGLAPIAVICGAAGTRITAPAPGGEDPSAAETLRARWWCRRAVDAARVAAAAMARMPPQIARAAACRPRRPPRASGRRFRDISLACASVLAAANHLQYRSAIRRRNRRRSDASRRASRRRDAKTETVRRIEIGQQGVSKLPASRRAGAESASCVMTNGCANTGRIWFVRSPRRFALLRSSVSAVRESADPASAESSRQEKL